MTILGTYPCCDGPLGLSDLPRTPAYLQENCPHCDSRVWHVIEDLIEPMTFMEDEFLQWYDVDYEKKVVTRKSPQVQAATRLDEVDSVLKRSLEQVRNGVAKAMGVLAHLLGRRK